MQGPQYKAVMREGKEGSYVKDRTILSHRARNFNAYYSTGPRKCKDREKSMMRDGKKPVLKWTIKVSKWKSLCTQLLHIPWEGMR